MPSHGYLEGITTALYVPSDLNRVMDVARQIVNLGEWD